MALIPLIFLVFLSNIYPEFVIGTEFTKNGKLETYIVHVKKPEGELLDLVRWHQSFLPISITASLSSDKQHPRMVYSYQNAISGFAARLSEKEVQAMRLKKGFVSARPQRVLQRQTTHSHNFLGLHQEVGFWKESNLGKGMIIGMLDSGAFPNHPSFSDEGMPPPPAKWKGSCEFNISISMCNNKIIGARTFRAGAEANGEIFEPPNNDDGHGTHTASTAAGRFVNFAQVLGNAKGTAAGMAPQAHLAIYKVCYFDECRESDILAGFDAAIADGVDVLSISLGVGSVPFFEDSIAIGSFAAIQNGIFVSCSAGNSGPSNTTLSNEAPWILTVGASTIDRSIRTITRLGNGEEFQGESFQPSDFPSKLLPLVYAGMDGASDSAFCGDGSLNALDVKGKVVLCEQGGEMGEIGKGRVVRSAGGAAMILMNGQADGFSLSAYDHVLPASHISFVDGEKVKHYISLNKTPMATILFKGTIIGDSLSPSVASFSSRGPNLQSPGILKPDIVGTGVSIVAAWPFPIRENPSSNSNFNVMSGTSMSCPHLSGVAALLKSSHPYWSPAAIKSAIMTSAEVVNLAGEDIVDQTLEPADVFATGAGHVNPSRANEPGLVYDIQPDDYIPYLCGLGYKDEEVAILARKTIKCLQEPSIPEGELNYPSFSVTLGPSQTFTRTVTNVGEANTSYAVIIGAPQGVYVSVKPKKLYFLHKNQKVTYLVTFSSSGSGYNSGFAQGYLKWVSAKYSVRSPISVRFG